MGLFTECTDSELADKLDRELGLHLMNDTAARDKVREAIKRLRDRSKSESSVVKQLRKENERLQKKLSKVKSILDD